MSKIHLETRTKNKKIFVGGLQAETTEDKLKEYFGEFGEVRSLF